MFVLKNLHNYKSSKEFSAFRTSLETSEVSTMSFHFHVYDEHADF